MKNVKGNAVEVYGRRRRTVLSRDALFLYTGVLAGAAAAYLGVLLGSRWPW